MDKAKVYFTDFRTDERHNLLQKLGRLIQKAGLKTLPLEGKFTAVKLHFGEPGNLAFLRANYARVVVDALKDAGARPFLTDSNTLYPGMRRNALDHLDAAYLNGFSPLQTGCHVIIADGLLGTDFVSVPVNGEFCSHALLGRAAVDAEAIVSLTHFKCHEGTGIGGALKNLGMGFGSAAGKREMHCDGKPTVTESDCVGCGMCIRECGSDAIALIDQGSSREQAAAALAKKYADRADVTAADISDVLDDIDELTAAGQLFAPDAYADHAFDFKNRSNVVKALCLHVAHTCNLNCSYCFAAQGKFHGEAGLMSFETGKRALDFLIENSGTRRNLEVDFFGGEPLMNFEVCKQLVAYARSIEKKYNKNFRFTMTTNGIGITDEVIDWCNKECHNVVLSLDGRKEVNDRFRVDLAGNGSYDRIVPKFQKLVKARGGQGYYMRGTFTHHNVDFTKDLFHMADDLGFTELSMEPVVAPPDSPEALTEEDLPKLFDQYELLANDMLRRQKAGKPITFYHYILDLKHGPCIYKRISGCGSGTEYMAVTPWGDLYPCHQFVGDPAYKLGNVWDGVTNTALRDEFKLCNVYARPDCKDCWARLYCAGGCAANALHATGDIHGTYEYGCKVFRKRMECALMMQVAQRLDPELAKNAVRFESDCDGCGEGNDGACEK